MQEGYDVLAKTGDVSAPASGATVTLWTSESRVMPGGSGRVYKALILNLYSSHVSGTDGVIIEESDDDGQTWATLVTHTLSAATRAKYRVQVSAPMVRARYTNSANTLSAFRWSILGDRTERGLD